MQGLIMTAQLLLSLSILIAVHEGGHFVAARIFKIKVEKFYLFFDFLFPMANVLNFALFKFKKGDTEYGIGWFPLGGYVKIAGMVDESMDKEQLKTAPQPWEFRSKPAWQRLIVMLGGIIINVVTGILIFIGLTYFLGDTYIPKEFVNTHGGIQSLELGEKIGLKTGDKIVKVNGKDYTDFQDVSRPDVLLTQGAYYTVDRNGKEIQISIPDDFIENFNKKSALGTFILPRIPAIVASIEPETDKKVKVARDPNSPDTATTIIKVTSIAKTIGLQAGDQFMEVNGEPVLYYDEVRAAIKSTSGDSISFKIRRGEKELSFKEDFRNRHTIGYYPAGIDKKELAYVDYGFGQSIGLGTTRAFDVVFNQLKAFGKLFTGKMDIRKSLSGPIGIAQAYGGEWDWERFWKMTGMLSMVLAFMNLLPIPALDGGYVMFLLYEMITGKEASEKFFETALKIGFAIIIVLIVFTFYNDFSKLFTN
jgi:regulator of sigma E protease